MEQLFCLKCRKTENLAREITDNKCRKCGGDLTKIVVNKPINQTKEKRVE